MHSLISKRYGLVDKPHPDCRPKIWPKRCALHECLWQLPLIELLIRACYSCSLFLKSSYCQNHVFCIDLKEVTLDKTTAYVLVNDRTEVLCNKPNGNPEPNITWTKEGGEKLPWEGFYVEGCCTLVNKNTNRTGSTNFTCTASNSYESSQKTIEVIVSGKLNFKFMWKRTRDFIIPWYFWILRMVHCW